MGCYFLHQRIFPTQGLNLCLLHWQADSLQLSYLGSHSLVAQMVKNLCAVQKTWVQSLDQEDTLEKKMATCSTIPAWKIPWPEDPGGL